MRTDFTNINCSICTGELTSKIARRERDIIGNLTGRWLCNKCWQKYDSNSQHNSHKEVTNRRTGNQNPNTNSAKGDNFEELTCRWRSTVSTLLVENLNRKLNNYHSPIDHSRDSELGIIQTKGYFYHHIRGTWGISHLEKEWNKQFDNYIFYCASRDGKIISRIYIFPGEEIKYKRTSVTITKNPSKGIQWYEKYRVKDENIVSIVNKIWKEIIY